MTPSPEALEANPVDKKNNLPPIILASSSPRRQQLLKTIGLEFTISPPDLDEEAVFLTGEYAGKPAPPPETQVAVLSRLKGETIARQAANTSGPTPIIISSDTTVAIDNHVLGKPKDKEDAFRMLSLIQGKMHEVWSAITVIHGDMELTRTRSTRVWMRPMDEDTRWRYIETGEPMDKAGSYAIQGYGSLLVERIEGCYFNVVGMSMPLLFELIEALGYRLI